MKKWLIADKRPCAINGMAVTQRFGLMDKVEAAGMIPRDLTFQATTIGTVFTAMKDVRLMVATGFTATIMTAVYIDLATRFSDLVIAVSVGNEALVDWNDHMVPVDKVIGYVRQVKASIEQPVTVADNYVWWARSGAALAAEVDFLGVHIYPLWEHKTIDQAMAYSLDNIRQVQEALPGKPLAILEAGWATAGKGFDEQANEANQERHFRELLDWGRTHNTTVFFFEAFDEPWKGDPNNPLDMEKHWGLFNADRSPKQVFQETIETKTP